MKAAILQTLKLLITKGTVLIKLYVPKAPFVMALSMLRKKSGSSGGAISLDALNDDILVEVLTQLASNCCNAKVPYSDEWLQQYPVICLVDRRFHRTAQLDAVWEPVCRRRWRLRMGEEAWIEAAQVAAEAAVAAAAAAASQQQQQQQPTPTWKAQYRLRQDSDILKEYPVFFMGGTLGLGQPFGIHFFEPRYRRLVRHAMDTDRRFVFATSRPRANGRAMLCECHRVQVYPDGRADLYVLPVATVAMKATRLEEFDPACPPLHWACVEENPQRDDDSREMLRGLLTAVRAALDGGVEPAEEDDEDGDDDESDDEDEDDEDDDDDDEEEGEEEEDKEEQEQEEAEEVS